MDILDDMGVSKLSAKVVLLFFFIFFKVNYSFKLIIKCVMKMRSCHHRIVERLQIKDRRLYSLILSSVIKADVL